ncbi:MAG: polysaccharide export outer membrane protein [Saprospiraceae bacterium]|jgi:polysaccharide export outer membrane protein
MKKLFQFIGVLLVIVGFSSCSTLSITKGRMFKTPLDYKYSKFDTTSLIQEYKIAVDDAIKLNLFANDGYNFMSLTGGAAGVEANGSNGTRNSFKVRSDSTIKVPIIGKVKVVGMTLEELEGHFERILEAQFQSPFVMAEIDNRRIYVFSGLSSASVYVLQNQKTTLFEVLANIGGIPGQSNASKIKIIRGDLKNPKVYKIDLSTLESMRDAELAMQAGDIIYIEPFINYASIFTSDVASVLSILTTSLLVYSLFNTGN